MNERIGFWNGVKQTDGTELTNEEKLNFCEKLNKMLMTSPEVAKIFYNTQVYNEIVNDVTTRGLHSLGVAIVGENLAIQKAKFDGKSEIEQKISGLLTRSLGYMHDLGHTPFGHDGENALNNEMERFDSTQNYREKREKLFGKEYTIQAGDLENNKMCYEHNETSAVIPQDLLDLLKQGVLKIDDLSLEEQGLLGLDENKLIIREQAEYDSYKMEEREDYRRDRKQEKLI